MNYAYQSNANTTPHVHDLQLSIRHIEPEFYWQSSCNLFLFVWVCLFKRLADNRVECIPVTVAVFDSFVAVNLASALQNCNLLYVNNLVFLFVSLSFSHFFFSIPKRNCPFQTAPPDRLSIQTKHLLFCMTCQFVFRYNLKWANFVSNRCSSLSSQRYRFVRTK